MVHFCYYAYFCRKSGNNHTKQGVSFSTVFSSFMVDVLPLINQFCYILATDHIVYFSKDCLLHCIEVWRRVMLKIKNSISAAWLIKTFKCFFWAFNACEYLSHYVNNGLENILVSLHELAVLFRYETKDIICYLPEI